MDANELIAQLEAQKKAWMETANQHCRNEMFYHGLLDAIGELFGDAAKTQDDGGIVDHVLALRVKDCVVAVIVERAAALHELAQIKARNQSK